MNYIKNYNIRKIVGLIGFFISMTASIAHAGNLSLPDPLNAGWEGKPVCENLFEDAEKRILRCTFPPGVGHERHFHAPHFGYAIAGGRVQITDQNGVRKLELSSGSSYTSEGTLWHEVINIGKTTIRYLIVERKKSPS